MGQDLDECCCSSGVEKRESEGERRKRAKEDRQQSLKKTLERVHAALLRSFRGQQKCLVWGEPGVSVSFGKANSHFSPTPGSGTALSR